MVWIVNVCDVFLLYFCSCTRCTNYDSALESPGVGNEKGASVLATYNNVDSEYYVTCTTVLCQF